MALTTARLLESAVERANESRGAARVTEASTVVGTDVLLEPFNNFTFAPWTISGATIGTGRTGSGCDMPAFSNGLAEYTIPSAVRADTLTLGFAYSIGALGSFDFLQLNSDGNTVIQNRMHQNSDGSITFQRNTSTLFTSAAGVITTGTWYYIEVQTKLHDTAGLYIVRVNGTEIANATNVDTKSGGSATTHDTIHLGGQLSTSYQRFDDLYLTTGAGAPFKGSITIP